MLSRNIIKKHHWFLFGGKEEVVQESADILTDTYPGLTISGYHSVYFDLVEDSQAIDNGMIVHCELDSGEKYRYSGNLIQFDQVKETKFTPTPLLGEQSFEILKEVGFQTEEIDSLVNENVIFVSKKDT